MATNGKYHNLHVQYNMSFSCNVYCSANLNITVYFQTNHVLPFFAGCKILSARASGPSSILVKWEPYSGAASYFLDLRVVNNTNVVPVVVSVPVSLTEKNVHGLKPGTEYIVTFKVFQFLYSAVCVTTVTAWTGKEQES